MRRATRIVLGLNSGTSADGIDAAACEIRGRGTAMRVRVIGHVATRYPDDLRERLLSVMAPAQARTEDICRLHSAIGLAFARAAQRARRILGLGQVDLIGSHGQTICHLPPRKSAGGARQRGDGETGTLQIGDASIIAAELGAPVVSDFRHADMAVGGQGAPLVPWTDFVLFQGEKSSRVIQNIGGIANLTWLPAGGGADDVVAFDCGPGNMIIDALVRHFTKGKQSYDRNGRLAARGRADERLFAAMSSGVDPFLLMPPPRSLGREEFGEPFVQTLLTAHDRSELRMEDWIATATHLTAQTIGLSYALHLGGARRGASRQRDGLGIDEVILCGGGARNQTLVELLRGYLAALNDGAPVSVLPMDELGISSQSKECVSFAMLAAACVDRVPANLPGVTGARRRVVLGQVTG